jgi:hypothetical protein
VSGRLLDEGGGPARALISMAGERRKHKMDQHAPFPNFSGCGRTLTDGWCQFLPSSQAHIPGATMPTQVHIHFSILEMDC